MPLTPLRAKTGQPTLYILLLALVIVIMVMLSRCPRRGIPTGHDGDTLHVAIEYAPMALYRYADTLGGFNYDLLRSIAASHDIALKFHPIATLTEGLDGIADGRYDILVADVGQSAAMMQTVAFTDPTFLDKQVLVQPRDSATGKGAVTSQLSLGGKSIHVPAGASSIERLENLSREIGDTIIIVPDAEHGSEQLFMLTALGEVPMAVVSEQTARRLARDYPQVDASLGISFTQFHGWMVSPENHELLDSLNSYINAFKETRAYTSLKRRYTR